MIWIIINIQNYKEVELDEGLVLLTDLDSSKLGHQVEFSLYSQNNRKQYPVNITSMFRQSSDVSVVITSCNRIQRLALTLNSFFHYNTYPIARMVIVEDCNPTLQASIWSMLPAGARSFPQYFTVLINQHNRGQIACIDVAYSFVTSAYVYHLEDDWVQVRGYGLIERLRDVLLYAENNGIKVSQVTQAALLSRTYHHLGKSSWTDRKVEFKESIAMGKEWLYYWTFNPSLFSIKLYSDELKSSLVQSVGERYHCEANDAGCVEKFLGDLLNYRGYKQLFVNLGSQPFYFHTGFEGFDNQPVQLSILEDETEKIPLHHEEVPRKEETHKSVIETLKQKKNKTQLAFLQVLFIMMAMLAIFGIFILIQSFCSSSKKFTPIAQTETTEEQI